MLVHIVLFKWKEHAPETTINHIIDELNYLKNKIDFIQEISAGKIFATDFEGYTHALVVKVDSHADLSEYRNHPAHQAIIQRIEEIKERIHRIDFES